jgi:two-component system sensor histidine kinase/response regulator
MRHILIVEDDPVIQSLIDAILTDEGYATLVCGDGQAGLSLARETRPALVLMDIMLPKLDGASVIQRLKSDPETSDIPIVAMSAASVLLQRGGSLQADAALSKPFDLDALLTTVAEHVDEGRRAEGGVS